MDAIIVDLPDEAATLRLGDGLALLLRPGDCIALSGPLGVGKTTLTRAILRSLSRDDALEVPSPTYTLVQPYEAGFRFPVAHVDLYRLSEADEIDELGLDEILLHGALIVEWPERGLDRLRIGVIAVELSGLETRQVRITAPAGKLAERLARFSEIRAFLEEAGYSEARRHFLQGDASPRLYERIIGSRSNPLILLNADAQPDRPVSPERKAYMATAHLVGNEDIVPVLAIATELARHGFSVPQIIAYSVPRRCILFEDLGQDYIAVDGAPVPERYETAIDVLLAMHRQDWPDIAGGPDGLTHVLPRYSLAAMQTEVALFLSAYLGGLIAKPADHAQRQAFLEAWQDPFNSLAVSPKSWTLFDYHSPNLHWLAGRFGLARIGIIDSQDARFGPEAYDVVSLIQDARVTITPALQDQLLARYLAGRRQSDRGFNEAVFSGAYAICGAQRATRILGVFARLAAQDGKPHYLNHIPRISAYLEHCLRHDALTELRAWFEANAPSALGREAEQGKNDR